MYIKFETNFIYRCNYAKMMTEEFYQAICHDDGNKLTDLIVDQDSTDLDSFQIWPGRSRRMTPLQLAVREGK